MQMLKKVIFLIAVLALLNKTMCFYIRKPTEANYTRSSNLIFSFEAPLSDHFQTKHENELTNNSRTGYINENNYNKKNAMKNPRINPNNTFEADGLQPFFEANNKSVTYDKSNDSSISSKKVSKTENNPNLDLINTQDNQKYKTTDKSDAATDYFLNEKSTGMPDYNEDILGGDLLNRADISARLLASLVG